MAIPNLIYDVGMNIAEDTPYYLAKGFQVIAIEANPVMVVNAKVRFAEQIESGDLVIIQGAIAKNPGQIRFYICDTMSALSTTETNLVEQHKRSGATFHEVMVDAIPFEMILHEYGIPHYLKVDIEGCDLLCVKALEQFGERPKCVSVEVNLFDYRELVKTAQGLGYSKFQLVAQSTIPKQRPPLPAREGKSINYNFVSGCSGPFGKDLPDTWESADEILKALSSLRWQHRAVGVARRMDNLLSSSERLASVARRAFPRTNDWYDLHMI